MNLFCKITLLMIKVSYFLHASSSIEFFCFDIFYKKTKSTDDSSNFVRRYSSLRRKRVYFSQSKSQFPEGTNKIAGGSTAKQIHGLGLKESRLVAGYGRVALSALCSRLDGSHQDVQVRPQDRLITR